MPSSREITICRGKKGEGTTAFYRFSLSDSQLLKVSSEKYEREKGVLPPAAAEKAALNGLIMREKEEAKKAISKAYGKCTKSMRRRARPLTL